MLQRQVDEASLRPRSRASFLPSADRRYEFEKRLGAGGMGIVRQVRDRALGRSVAMKQLNADAMLEDEHVGTLVAEARVAGMLEHPNIMPIYDVGMTAAGEPYYTMRLMDSMSLEDVLELLRDGNPEAGRQYPLVRLLRILQQICMAVDYAHQHGVIHRDLKPENFRLGRYGEVQVADWGLATVEGLPDLPLRKALEDARERGEIDPCIVIGSPNYMSPEQACGRNDELMPSADIYSLGCVLYELLTLHVPFEDTDTMVLLDRVERDEVVPPSQLTPNRLIPPELEELCMAALEKQPEDRIQDVRVFWRALENYVEGRQQREVADDKAFEQVQRGQRFSDAYARLRDARDDLAKRLETARADGDADTPRLERELASVELSIANAWGEAYDAYTRAIGYSKRDLVARAKLADLAWSRLQDAENDGDDLSCQLFWKMLNRFNDGPWDRFVVGSAQLLVDSSPAGATVHLGSYNADADAGESPSQALGRTPLEADKLGAGLYLLSVELDGHKTLTRPVFLRANSQRAFSVTLDPT